MHMHIEHPIPKRLLPLWATSLVQIFTLVVLAYLGWYSWYTYRETGVVQQRNSRMLELASTIQHHDVSLTMCARMAAATGDLQWLSQYREIAPQVDAAIVELQRVASEVYSDMSGPAARADSANTQLVAMEERALRRVRSGDLVPAMNMLFSEEYNRQKDAYSEATGQIMDSIADYVKDREHVQYRKAVWAVILVLIALPLEVLMWIVEVHYIRQAAP